MVSIRPIAQDDLDTVKKWYHGDHQKYLEIIEPERWFGMLDANRRGYIILSSKQPVGYIDIEIRGRIAHIAFYVAPQYRRQGYAKQALILLENDTSLHLLQASVEEDNIAAQKTLKALGYAQKGTDKDGLIIFEKVINISEPI